MRDSNQPAGEVRTIQLPSGREVQIAYIDGVAALIADQPLTAVEIESELDEAVAELLNCGACGYDLVQPVEWDGYGDSHWKIELRCPNCESRCTTIVEDDVAEACDQAHQHGADQLEATMRELAADNDEQQIKRFSEALQQNHLLPEDF